MSMTIPNRRPQRARSRPHWSYSQLNQFMRCPLQFYFERVIKLPRPFIPSGLLFGSAVHEALAEYHSQLRSQLEIRPEAVREQFLLTWQTREEEMPVRFGNNESRDDLLDQGATLLDKYLHEPPPQQIVGIEEEMVVPLYTSRGELLDAPLIAVLDLMCRAEDGLTVVEFKTSKRKYGEAELEMALQATCYINAIQERYGEPVSLNYIVLVKTKTSPCWTRVELDRCTLSSQAEIMPEIVELTEFGDLRLSRHACRNCELSEGNPLLGKIFAGLLLPDVK